MVKKILVATDGSGHARKAVAYATDIASKYKAKIYLMHVVQEPKIPEGIIEFVKDEHIQESPTYVYLQTLGEKILGAAEREVRETGIDEVESVVTQGDPAERILEFAKQNAIDMIVMGSRGLGKVESLFLGSVSNRVCHLAESTCVTVK
jgi:nucleotide-binding universal stress UspA family protein